MKIATLALALTCVGASVPPTEHARMVVAASDSASGKLRCRLYFGCVRAVRTAAEGLFIKE
jgi:hypothetical protein